MNFEIYENNGGALLLALFGEDGTCSNIFENWEYGPENILSEAVDMLMEDPFSFRYWEGDLVERMNQDRQNELDLARARGYYLVATEPWTAESLWPLVSNNDPGTELVSGGDTETGEWWFNPDRMGFAARRALGISD